MHPKFYSFDDIVHNAGEGEDEDHEDQDAQEEGTVRAEGDVADPDELESLEVETLEIDSLLREPSGAGSEESSMQESPERAYPNEDVRGSLANGRLTKLLDSEGDGTITRPEASQLVSTAPSKQDMSDPPLGSGTGKLAENAQGHAGCAESLELSISARPGSSRARPMANGQTSPPRAPEETAAQNGDARYVEAEASSRSRSSERDLRPTSATGPVDKGKAKASTTTDKPPSTVASAPDPDSLGTETAREGIPLASSTSTTAAATAKKGEKEDEGEWMSSWWKTYDANERRFREWTAKYYREGYCLRHDPENLVEITEDTLSGVHLSNSQPTLLTCPSGVKSDWWDSYEFTEGKEDSEDP